MKAILERKNNKKEDIRDIYLHKLARQFIQATGATNIELNSANFLNEFNNWLNERQAIAKEYKEIMDYLGINFEGQENAEVGKGAFDTIALPKSKMKIITPYTYGFDKNNIIKGKIKIVPEIVPEKDITKEPELNTINCFMTENPYKKSNIENWEVLFYLYHYSIITGLYGKIYDKDKDSKINSLKTLKEQLKGNLKEEYIKVNDDYFYILASTDKNYEKLKGKRIGRR